MSKNLRWDAERQRWVFSPGFPGGSVSIRSVSDYPVRSFTVLGLLAVLVLTAMFLLPDDLLTSGGPSDGEEESAASSTSEPEEDPTESPPGDKPTKDPDEGEEEAAPDDYWLQEDEQGFDLLVPEGWSREEDLFADGTFKVFFTPNSRRHFLQVRTFGPDITHPGQALDRLESDAGSLPEFDKEDRNTGAGQESDEVLSYRYKHDVHGSYRVFARALLGEDGQMYAILAAGPGREYNGVHDRFVGSAYSFHAGGDDQS
ncbi:hypothetical protein [Nocardiopsis sp. JB363]|uniref:hypothetical protein n=1 Tax=Nocardiopsis sp. JB363 TaxID=1434837 RepID=UPI00097B9E93|nr:hypothetical protein [Nocardiopsis sp. JB363]SIO87812.1 hypothetical protein BQ8420_17480 [Nocardiopsis sp. JB363]